MVGASLLVKLGCRRAGAPRNPKVMPSILLSLWGESQCPWLCDSSATCMSVARTRAGGVPTKSLVWMWGSCTGQLPWESS